MENKGKFIDKYLFNLKFTVAITGLKNVMSCCIDVHYLLYYRYDLLYGMSGGLSGEVSWFVPPLSLSQLRQPDQESN